MRTKIILSAIALSLATSAYAADSGSTEKNNITQTNQPVFGLIEKVTLLPDNLSLNAKMDTGAQTSSLDARNIEQFEKDNDQWVRFNVISENDNNRSVTYERKIVKVLKLKGAGGKDKRPEVLMKVCIGNQSYEEPFTLRDRSDMKYPVLIGQKTIAHLGLIDVNREFTIEPKCQE